MTAPAVSILDLGLGNIRSVARALERAGAAPRVVEDSAQVAKSERLVVPGQGAFRDCARALSAELGDAVAELIRAGRPYFGICLGMQVLFESSAEAPGDPGLGIFEGTVTRFREDQRDPDTGDRLKVPHMGWNAVPGNHPYLPERGWFYFVHSYYCVPTSESIVVATADYGSRFCAAVARDNVFACQFHPEKSQEEGHRVLERFVHA